MKSYYDPYALGNIRRHLEEVLGRKKWARLDDDIVVWIPNGTDVQNRLYIHKDKDSEAAAVVDLIYETWYDKDTKQSRNRKARIGKISQFFPGMMFINENYEKFFDLETGKLLRPFKDMEEPKPATLPKPKAADKTPRKNTAQQQPDQPKTPQPQTPKTDANTSADPEDGDWSERIRETIREVRRNAEEMRKKELENKIRGEEDERRRELFEDMAAGEDVETREAEKRLSAILQRIEAEHADKGSQNDMNNKEENKNAQPTDTDSQDNQGNPQLPTDPDNPAETGDKEDEDKRLYRLAVLNQILKGIRESIRNQAKKKPDAIINTYKARSINKILLEIQSYYQGSGYEDLLTLVEEPGEEEHDGRVILTGMTYSDVEVLLEKYIAIVRFIRNKST